MKTHPTPDQKPVTLIHHAASGPHTSPPNSLTALENCLAAGAAVIEIDAIPLGDGSFALLHDQDLGAGTTGSGLAPKMARAQIEDFTYLHHGVPTEEKIGFLDQALILLQRYPETARLQIDLKPFTPLTEPVIDQLLALIQPVINRVQVSSVADWAVRALAQAAPNLALGFDPLLYIDLVEDQPRPENIPPFRVGAYGLLDDHPLAAFHWGKQDAYFAARAEALMQLAPAGCQWFIRAQLLKMSLDASFDWIANLHQHGSAVTGWTIDADQPSQVALADELVERGIDCLTTDSPSRLAARLQTQAVY